jgi:hypothetical protein
MAQFCSGTLAPKLRVLADRLPNCNWLLSEDDYAGGSQFALEYIPNLKVTLAPYVASLCHAAVLVRCQY